jgi:hypothetical protein
MPATLAPGLWSLMVSAGLSVSYQAGVRAETRAEQIRPAVGEDTTTGVLEVEPAVGLQGRSPALQLELAYSPRFTRLGGDGPDSDSWLHRAWAMARWRPDAAWQLQAHLTATAGTVDLFRVTTAPDQPGAPPPVGQAAPVATTLDYLRYELALTAEGRLGRHLELRSGLTLMSEGGANAEERLTLPLQRAALARGSLEWGVTRRTTLAAVFAASVTHYFDVAVPIAEGGTGFQDWSNWMGRLEALWRYDLTRHARLWAGAGAVLVDSQAPLVGGRALQPFGEAGLTGESGPGWPQYSGGVLLAGAPVEDRLTGTVAERAEARAWGTWSPAEHWTLGASGLGARVMNGPTARAAFTAGEFWLSRAVRDVFSVAVGGRWTTQWQPEAPGRTGLPSSQWVAYLSLRAAHRSDERSAAGRPAF